MNRPLSVIVTASFFSACSSSLAADAPAMLRQLFDDRYAWEMREFPETAMSRGDYSRADRITDLSLAAIERRKKETVGFLDRLHALDRATLNEEDQLNYDLFEQDLKNDIEEHRFRMFLAPVGPRDGPHQSIPQMADRVRFDTREDYVNFLKRLELTPRAIDDIIERLRLGLKEGRTPPKVTMGGLAHQFESLRSGGLDALAKPFEKMPADISSEQRAELSQRFRDQSLPAVSEALDRLGTYLTGEYLPHCRPTIAAGDLPDGEAYYALRLRVNTTTEMSAKEIHELGLREVARIKDEMMKVIRASDFSKHKPETSQLAEQPLFQSFIQYLRTDPRFYHKSADELVTGYRDICKRVDAGLPKLFQKLPRLPYGVREIPAFMAPDQTTAYYEHGDIRNAEPGWFYCNTYALDQRPTYEMISLAMHESVPGHHLQVALAQELEDVPEFRKNMWVTAFGEGWALYSERLGIEMGLYGDPYDDFGRLLYEMWRACRLVVDPGMHALGWSRERAVRFMLDNTALSELNINTEIDRYINWPGQATGYKIGELKIRELREEATKRLGDKFDLRAFHEVVLGAGCLPLNILEKRVNAWIGRQPAATASR